jgi:hypothetical protein
MPKVDKNVEITQQHKDCIRFSASINMSSRRDLA